MGHENPSFYTIRGHLTPIDPIDQNLFHSAETFSKDRGFLQGMRKRDAALPFDDRVARRSERQLRLWYNETTLAAVIDRQCLKERLLPPDIARMALFLAADDSRMITKQTFVVDAGLL